MVSAEYSVDLKLSTLLNEARPSAASLRAAGEAVDAVAQLIKSVPPQQVAPEAASGFVRDLGLAAEKLTFSFRPPEVVRLAGSHAAGAVARPDVAADLLVRLPKVCVALCFSQFISSGNCSKRISAQLCYVHWRS
jgi:U3 small nucleolar RNA-associated protein 22